MLGCLTIGIVNILYLSIFIILALAAHYSKPDQGALRKWKIAGDVFFAVIGNSN